MSNEKLERLSKAITDLILDIMIVTSPKEIDSDKESGFIYEKVESILDILFTT